MGATNTTSHYELSQFVSTDKPAWLQDYNGDMAKIDAGINESKVAADTAQTTANAASGAATQAASDITALTTTVTGQGTNITALQLSVNTINSLIGNGLPTTTDQTIIGAINEINAKVTDMSTATLGSAIQLTLNTDYTCDKDGYLKVGVGNSTSEWVAGYVNSVGLVTLGGSSTADNTLSVFVRKGSAIKYNGTTRSNGFFIPIE